MIIYNILICQIRHYPPTFRDCWQIALNGFCPLTKTPHPLVLNGQYQDEWNINQNWMKNTLPFYIVFQVLKVLLCRISHQIFYFFIAFTSADISFFTNFLNFIQHYIYEKKIFVTNFPFLMDSLISATPIRPQSAKQDKSFLLLLP